MNLEEAARVTQFLREVLAHVEHLTALTPTLWDDKVIQSAENLINSPVAVPTIQLLHALSQEMENLPHDSIPSFERLVRHVLENS